jgi:hypothetical protein
MAHLCSRTAQSSQRMLTETGPTAGLTCHPSRRKLDEPRSDETLTTVTDRNYRAQHGKGVSDYAKRHQ